MRIDFAVMEARGFHCEVKSNSLEIFPTRMMDWEKVKGALAPFDLNDIALDIAISKIQHLQVLQAMDAI